MKIIALLGMPGSGKTEASSFLESNGYKQIRFGDITDEVLKEKNLDINEENEKVIREQLRKEHGMAAYAILNLPRIKQLDKVVLDGVRSYAEVETLRKEFDSSIIFVSIICSKELRYKRISERKYRGLSEEEIISRDVAEVRNLDMGTAIVMADKFIINDGSKEELHKQLFF